MQFGLYAPVPHVSVGSSAILQSVAGGREPLAQHELDPAYILARDVLLEAERQNFDIILFAERHLGADMEAWILASAISSLTQRIRSMVAVHPGLWYPQIIAKMSASLDRLTRGRMALNLITGWNVEEHTMFGGDTMLHNDDRYVRAEEFIEVIRGMWRQSPYSFKGQFYDVRDAQLLLAPATPEPPEVFTASRSPRGLDMIAKVADWWFVDYNKEAGGVEDVMESLEQAMENVRRRAAKLGRRVRFAYNPFVCFGDSVEDARKRAQSLVAVDGSDADVRKLMNRIGPSMKSGCVGHPDQVRAQIERFRAMGIELLLFKYVPSVEETRAIGREIIEPMRARWAQDALAGAK
ncbi:MAG: LLM class flavin-dependent oxidoreductase [Alphaproteobacteria bacterium]|nr:LLM class flavin-dependent oxidoreductase [Alphaproteobacteria bacterium]